MVDLETMGTNSYAPILSIGAVRFSVERDVKIDSFHVSIDLASCMKAGMRPDPETIMWWWDPKLAAARAAYLAMKRVDLAEALDGFQTWLGEDTSKLRIWGNGSDFDNVLLSNAYKLVFNSVPWRYTQHRCFRTLKAMVPKEVYDTVEPFGVAHDALNDAMLQSRQATAIYGYLRRRR